MHCLTANQEIIFKNVSLVILSFGFPYNCTNILSIRRSHSDDYEWI